MALPSSLGKAGVSADELMEESLALKKPFGVPVLSLQPEEYEADRGTLEVRLDRRIQKFLAEQSGGNEAKAQIFAQAYAEGCGHIPKCLMKSASDPDYKDGHTGWLQGPRGEALGGMIVEPRKANYSWGGFVGMLTGLPADKLNLPEVPAAEARFLCHWHEAAHCAGAYEEPQADTLASLMAKKAFPNSKMLQSYADARALNALFAANSEHCDERLERYGWAMVEAVDAVVAMPAQVKAMDESAILSFRKKEFNYHVAAMKQLHAALEKQDPGVLQSRDLGRVGDALNSVLHNGALGEGNRETAKIGKRLLKAARHLSPDVTLNQSASVIPAQAGRRPHGYQNSRR